jgi:hypothetical protein
MGLSKWIYTDYIRLRLFKTDTQIFVTTDGVGSFLAYDRFHVVRGCSPLQNAGYVYRALDSCDMFFS